MSLVLTRKLDEKIVIAKGEITITVVRLTGTRVSLLLEAPSDIDIVRAELLQKQENETNVD